MVNYHSEISLRGKKMVHGEKCFVRMSYRKMPSRADVHATLSPLRRYDEDDEGFLQALIRPEEDRLRVRPELPWRGPAGLA